MKYNGDFIDLMNGKMFDLSSISDGPSVIYEKSEEKDVSSKYDISWT